MRGFDLDAGPPDGWRDGNRDGGTDVCGDGGGTCRNTNRRTGWTIRFRIGWWTLNTEGRVELRWE